MKSRLANFWEKLSSSLWFVPTVMTVFAFALAIGSVEIDTIFKEERGWTFGGGPAGAREVLSAIAASMITVAGVAFSITIVALTLASQQFGPRLLRNFMRDRGNQVVLGAFIATFTYSLIVLRTIRSADGDFVPHLSVTMAIAFALASLGVLIYFIHHAAVTIQAPEVISRVATELNEGVDRLFPEALGRPPKEDEDEINPQLIKQFEREAKPALCRTTGYLQSIDNDRLMALASENDLVFLLPCRPGDFLIEGSDLIQIKSSAQIEEHRIDEQMTVKINKCFIFGDQRTQIQDIEFTVGQLVEVAVRALSPAFNDPITAMSCIDRLTAALCRLAERSMPSACRYDDHDQLRIIVARPARFGEIVDGAFDSIRQYGRSSAPVTERLLEAIALIAKRVKREKDRTALLNQAVMIERGSHEGLPEECDRQEVQERFRKAVLALQERSWREPLGRSAIRQV